MNSSNTDSNVLALRHAVRYTSNTRSIERTFDRTPYTLRSTAMSVALAETVALPAERARADLRLVEELVEPTTPVRQRPRRSGPGVGPVARPRRLRFTAPAPARPAACRTPQAVASPRPQSWRLTERGLAVVLVLAGALVAASVAVVALTALRVTGESYHPGPSVSAPVVVQP